MKESDTEKSRPVFVTPEPLEKTKHSHKKRHKAEDYLNRLKKKKNIFKNNESQQEGKPPNSENMEDSCEIPYMETINGQKNEILLDVSNIDLISTKMNNNSSAEMRRSCESLSGVTENNRTSSLQEINISNYSEEDRSKSSHQPIVTTKDRNDSHGSQKMSHIESGIAQTDVQGEHKPKMSKLVRNIIITVYVFLYFIAFVIMALLGTYIMGG